MTSLQIQYFLKVADTMSFSRAAAELYVSQPAISRQIRFLEEEIGYPLFDRTRKNRIILTSAGMLFRDCFREAEKGFEAACSSARELSDCTPLRFRVGIGAGWDLTEELLRFRGEVMRHYPQADIHFECDAFLPLREKLRSGELDAIVCTKTSIMDFSGLDITTTGALEPRAYVRRGLLRPDGEPLCIEDFSHKKLFMLQEDEAPMAMELVMIQFQAHQVTVEPVWLPNRDSILQAVLLGDGFTVFDQHMLFQHDPRLTWFAMEELIPLCIVQNKGKNNPLVHLFAEILSADKHE